MRVAVIGRTETLFEAAIQMKAMGHEIPLIVTAKEAPEYSKTTEDFRLLAKKWGSRFISTGRIKDIIPIVLEMEPIDISISMNYSGIIPKSVIDLFPLGILNAHGGDLPRYRGNACKAWAIINGETRVGLCIHRMIGGELDSGDILARDYHPIQINTKVTELYQWMDSRIPTLFSEAVASLQNDPQFVLEKQSKNPQVALRCYPRKPEDGLIDWKVPNLQVLRLINACNKPYAGAFGGFEGKKMIIWEATLAPEENFLAVPGQVTALGDGWVDIACGIGKIRVSLIEYEGETITPDKLIRSIRQRVTSIF